MVDTAGSNYSYIWAEVRIDETNSRTLGDIFNQEVAWIYSRLHYS